jgi:hypothetical protein
MYPAIRFNPLKKRPLQLRKLLRFSGLVFFLMTPLFAQETEFNWSKYRVSIADLLISGEQGTDTDSSESISFQHNKAEFSAKERAAYIQLWEAVAVQRFAAGSDVENLPLSPAGAENLWQTSFYEYEAARRKAWKNRQLLLSRPAGSGTTGLNSPNSGEAPAANPARREPATAYSLIADMASYPEDFVGRPVVLYGLYSPSGIFEPAGRSADGTSESFSDDEVRRLTLKRGTLRNLEGTETLAIVDSAGYLGPENQTQEETTWRVEPGTEVPVLVKGWFVKMWGKQPLIFTKAVRLLSERPSDQLIRSFTTQRSTLQEEEKWLYYETLRQLQLTSAGTQAREAQRVLSRRIRQLMREIRDKATADREVLAGKFRQGGVSAEEHRVLRQRLDRQVAVRVDRHEGYLNNPSKFPAYVDVFQNPEQWHGSLVSLSGHVRRVVSYQGDEKLFGGQMLHELWLYTDDSQHNPAVIVTPVLPPDFPVNAEVVDRVFVTGCFFKTYVYRADTERRIAPLLLAGRVQWDPSDSQVRALAAQGALPAQSALVRAAVRRAGTGISETTVMLTGFLCILVMMTIWGRVQRDRRERRRLLSLVDAGSDFDQTFSASGAMSFPDYKADPFRE